MRSEETLKKEAELKKEILEYAVSITEKFPIAGIETADIEARIKNDLDRDFSGFTISRIEGFIKMMTKSERAKILNEEDLGFLLAVVGRYVAADAEEDKTKAEDILLKLKAIVPSGKMEQKWDEIKKNCREFFLEDERYSEVIILDSESPSIIKIIMAQERSVKT